VKALSAARGAVSESLRSMATALADAPAVLPRSSSLMNPRPRSTPFEEMIGDLFGGGFNRYCGGFAATAVISLSHLMTVLSV